VNQGALALQARAGSTLAGELRALADPRAEAELAAERGFLEGVGGDCFVPIAALGECDGEGGLRLRGLVAAPDGSRVARGELGGAAREAAALGAALAERVLAAGGAAILAGLRGAA
jgi:hydroxymethylbilane synthase